MELPRRTFGCGSAYANDRLEPAAALADSGRVGYLGFDCLAERTMAVWPNVAESAAIARSCVAIPRDRCIDWPQT